MDSVSLDSLGDNPVETALAPVFDDYAKWVIKCRREIDKFAKRGEKYVADWGYEPLLDKIMYNLKLYGITAGRSAWVRCSDWLIQAYGRAFFYLVVFVYPANDEEKFTALFRPEVFLLFKGSVSFGYYMDPPRHWRMVEHDSYSLLEDHSAENVRAFLGLSENTRV